MKNIFGIILLFTASVLYGVGTITQFILDENHHLTEIQNDYWTVLTSAVALFVLILGFIFSAFRSSNEIGLANEWLLVLTSLPFGVITIFNLFAFFTEIEADLWAYTALTAILNFGVSFTLMVAYLRRSLPSQYPIPMFDN